MMWRSWHMNYRAHVDAFYSEYHAKMAALDSDAESKK